MRFAKLAATAVFTLVPAVLASAAGHSGSSHHGATSGPLVVAPGGGGSCPSFTGSPGDITFTLNVDDGCNVEARAYVKYTGEYGLITTTYGNVITTSGNSVASFGLFDGILSYGGQALISGKWVTVQLGT